MSGHLCTCGYAALDCADLGDHWGEAFIPADDTDASGVRHAEAAREPSPRRDPGGPQASVADVQGRDLDGPRGPVTGMHRRDPDGPLPSAASVHGSDPDRSLASAADVHGSDPDGPRGSVAGVQPDGAGAAAPAAFGCLCGAAFDNLGKLDAHLLEAFIPADHVGLDGRAHALAA